jgi:hypothetical protein
LNAKGKPDSGARWFNSVQSNGATKQGSTHWEAKYQSPMKPGRLVRKTVHNKIDSQFWFNEQALIVKHADSFSFYAWAKMAFGRVEMIASHVW